jgi:hypothetical protein
MENDLSHVFANDPDEGQVHHGNLPDEAMLHFARAFAAKAGITKHPGVYSGPPIKAPADWETPDDAEGQRTDLQQSAIQNLSEGDPPVIPVSAPAKGPKTVGPPSDQPDFSTL